MEKTKKVKDWIEEKSATAKQKVMAKIDWGKQHQEVVVIFGPVLLGSVVELIKIATKHHNISEERALKDRYIYDSSNRHYYEMRRKPKTKEWLQIDQRRENGESLGWILSDMGLLK